MHPSDNYQPPQESREHGVHNPLKVMQPGEQMICEIRRHPVGVIAVYTVCGALLLMLAVLVFAVLPKAAGSDHPGAMVLGVVGFLAATLVVLVFAFIYNTVYWGNSWIVTSDSLTQITQTGLFTKQSSQLSLGNLEDVSSEKNGFFSEVLNMGVLKAETAGEHSKFIFLYCPNPDYYARKILSAREVFEQARRGDEQEPQQQDQ
jgi:uncharacterized membrane protein YdbT with pleckstrin-like domain